MFNPATFPTLQQNPFLQGVNAAQGYQRNSLQNQNLAIQNQQAPQLLALRQALAQVAQENAARGLQNIALQYTKEKDTRQNALNNAQRNPGIQALLATDPQAQQGSLQSTKDFFTQSYGQQPQMMQGAQQMPSQIPMAQSGQPMPQQIPPQQMQGTISPQTLAAATDATQSNIIKRNVPAQVQQQRYFNQTLPQLSDKIKAELPGASKYFGNIGQLHAALNKYGLMPFGWNPSPDYQNYLNLQQDYGFYGNEAKRSLSGQATDQEQREIQQLTKPNFRSSTQQSALNNIRNLDNVFHTVDRTANLSPAQVAQPPSTPRSSSSSPSLATQPSTSTASGGTVLMIGTDGKRYHVKANQAQDAQQSYGWRLANG